MDLGRLHNNTLGKQRSNKLRRRLNNKQLRTTHKNKLGWRIAKPKLKKLRKNMLRRRLSMRQWRRWNKPPLEKKYLACLCSEDAKRYQSPCANLGKTKKENKKTRRRKGLPSQRNHDLPQKKSDFAWLLRRLAAESKQTKGNFDGRS